MDATTTARGEPWPTWARVMIALLAILTVSTALPWLLMGTTMAASCMGMMGGMPMPMGR